MPDTPTAFNPTRTGMVFDIKKFAIHDGPGIRTTVFLKGCPLRCAWCHNPESQKLKPEISFLRSKCIGCGYCFKACPQGAHAMKAEQHTLDRAKCVVCGSCTKECYAQALELSGKPMSVGEVLAEVMKDKAFYDNSGGGMTLSGGEPTVQYEFTRDLLSAGKASGLHNCLDTCGYAPYEKLADLMPLVDMFLYDLKATDDGTHRRLTGVPLAPVMENLHRLHQAGACIRLRLPLIPGLNATHEHLQACGQLVAGLPKLHGVDVMPYHRLGLSKNERFGYADNTEVASIESPENATVEAWILELRAAGAPQAQRS